MEAASSRRIVPVLLVGPADRRRIDQLREEGIGVIHVEHVERALRVLQDFRVEAVICAEPRLQALPALAAANATIIVLASQDVECDAPGVTVVKRDTSPAALALRVREAIASTSRGDAA